MENWKTRLRETREAKGIRKRAFAQLVGVSAPTATDWEKEVGDGGIKELAGRNLTKVCEVLGVDPNWLLHGDDRQALARRVVVEEPRVPYMLEPAEPAPARSGDILSMKVETAEELKMLIVYRSANEREREAIDDLIDELRLKIEARARNQTKLTG
jgi:transcriptional regulator with XRE-family HTH domain